MALHVLLSVVLLASSHAQTLVQFSPSAGYSGQSTPVAAGFAYAFRAPAAAAKSIDGYKSNSYSSPLAKTFQSHHGSQYASPVENTIVPMYHARPSPAYYEPIIPQVTKTQYHSQDELGQYAYGYVHNDASHHEERTLHGGVSGTYSYFDNEGNKQSANYVADRHGYRVEGTNLPVPAPVSVKHTPEVEAATYAHLQAVSEARARKGRGHHIHVGIGETPEVAAARAAHLQAFDKIKRDHAKRWRRSAHRYHGSGQQYQQQSYPQQHYQASSPHNLHVPVTPTPAVQAATYAHLQAVNQAHKYGGHVPLGVQDTPAVAAAKEAHFYAYQQIQQDHANRWKRSAHRYHGGGQQYQQQSYPQQHYQASSPHKINHPVTPTPAVQAATYAHLQAVNQAHKYGGHVPLGVQDTPAVAAAKEAHFYAYQQIQQDHANWWKRSAHRYHGGNHQHHQQSYPQQHYQASSPHKINHPVTPTPAVQAATYAHLQAVNQAHKYGGHVPLGVQDTPAVAAAKDAHFYAYQQIQQDHANRWKRSAHRYYPEPPSKVSSPHNLPVSVTPTPAVQAATYAHLQAVNQANKYGGHVPLGVQDTPAVAAAKEAHFYAYQQIQQDHANRWKRSAHRYHGGNRQHHQQSYPQQHYQASSPHKINHPVTPTPAVQAATYAHLQAVNQAHKYGGHVPLGVQDTPAVAAAKEAHFYAYQQIQQDHANRWKRSAHRYHGGNHQHHQQSYPQQHYQASSPHKLNYPVTPTPAVQAATYAHLQAVNQAHKYGGHVPLGVQDTPAVAAAKDAHFYAYQQIQQDHANRWKRSAHRYYPEPPSKVSSPHNLPVSVTPTPAVQAATYAHLQAVHQANKYGGHVPLGVQDTHAVAAAKEAHFYAYQQIQQDHANRW